MKRILLSLVSVMLLASVANSQGFYARVGVGLSGGTTCNLDMLYKYTNDGTTRKIEVVPVDLGSGFTGAASVGYMVKKYFGFELSISQFLGFSNVGDSIMRIPGAMNATAKISGSMLSVIPAVVITAGLDKVNPYARFGIVLGVMPRIYGRYEATQTTNPPTDIVIWKQFYGGMALGFNATAGVDFNLSKVVNFFVEATFNGITWSPNYSEIVTWTKNGVDELPTKNAKEIKTKYYSTIDLNEQIPDTNPDKKLRSTYPFNNAGVSFGVKFKF